MLFLDFLLLIMTMVCIGYSWMLSKRIQDLHNSRIEFARMIKELNVSVLKAENNINEMSKLSEITSTELENAVNQARQVIIDLGKAANSAAANSANSAAGSYSRESEESRTQESVQSSSRFTDEDFAPIVDDEPTSMMAKHTNNMKNFIHNIVTKTRKIESEDAAQNNSYYDTLRKINTKK